MGGAFRARGGDVLPAALRRGSGDAAQLLHDRDRAARGAGRPDRRAIGTGCRSPDRTPRIALWGVREILSLIFASLLAGLATTPYAAFHFKRIALRETPNMPMDTVLPWEQFPVPA